jgi:outer membrane usher protein
VTAFGIKSIKGLGGRARLIYFNRIFCTFVCCLSVTPLTCWPAEVIKAAAKAPQTETLVLKVRLNTEDKGDFFVSRTNDLDFLVKLEDLKTMGFKEPSGTVILLEGEPHLSLKSMRGVSFSFDDKVLALNITAEPGLLPSRSLDLQGQRRVRGTTTKGNSAFFNYALDYAKSDSNPASTIGFSGELGWRAGDYLFLSNANTVQGADGGRRLVRLMSSVTHDDMEDLRRIVIGDFFTPSRDLSSGVNLGGLSISKLYGLNPYLVQFPMQSVSGTVALPSDLEVYLDGQRIRTEKLNPGGFELNDILAYGGARSVRLVLRDSFGRVQEFNYSFYFSDQPLRKGLHEYSYNVGAMRRSYGMASNQYGPPAVAMFHRYGVSDALTLGLRAEAKRSFYNAGPLATVVLGSAGVANLALAGSSVDGRRGAAGSAAYNYQANDFGLGLAARRDWGEYATLGDPPTISTRRYEGSAVVTYNFRGFGALSLSHSARSSRPSRPADPTAPPSQLLNLTSPEYQGITTLSYSAPLVAGRASLTASLSRIKERESRNEVTLRLIVFLDKDYSVGTNYQGSKSGHTENIQFTKNQPIGEGLGYVLNADQTTDPTTRSWQSRSTLQYNAAAAIVRGEYGRSQGSAPAVNDYGLSVAGGVAYVDGTVGFGRPVTGSFGIVKVGELANVDVSVNGQPMGKTNASGKLFVPTLNDFFDNDVSIAPESVPIEYSIPATTRKVTPPLHGGMVIDFAVTKVQAFTGKLKYLQAAGAIKPVEFQEISISAAGKKQTFESGHGGEFYLENLKPGTYPATVEVEGKPCLFDIVIPKSDETFVELGDLMCRTSP